MGKNKRSKKIDINYLAQLADLTISPKEKKGLTQQLEKTVNYVAVLDELPTTNISPTSQVTGLKNVSRPDKIEKGLRQKNALKNAPAATHEYFVAQKVKWE